MPNFKCTKCGYDVEFELRDYRIVGPEKILCPNCNAEYYIKSPATTKEKIKKWSVAFGKFLQKAGEAGREALINMQEQYDSAQGKLDDKGIADWDEDELRRNLKNSFNTYERAIIRQKLQHSY